MTDLVFGKYAISHRLAVGGMGEVHYATEAGKPVVLKALLPDLAKQDGFVQQFLDEARLAARLDHPNVVTLAEVGVWNGTYVIAMEYVHGRDVAELLRRSAHRQLPVPVTVAARIIADAALGLDHAHQLVDERGKPLNVVHRDISPQNLMVREDGLSKVVDFGIARASTHSTRTATGVIKGKLAYMAPEQIGGLALTALTDQFALGLVFWELLTGTRHYAAPTDVELIPLVMAAQLRSPRTLRPEVPAALERVVSRMVAKNPTERFARCRDVADALGAALPPTARADVAAFMKALGSDDLEQKRAPQSSSLGNQVFAIGRAAQKPSQADLTTPLAAPRAAPQPTATPSVPSTPKHGRALPTGVIYSHSIKAFVDQLLIRRGLLSVEFTKTVTALGVDISKPRDLPYANWIELLRLTAGRLDPKRPLEDMLDELGHEMFRGFAQSMLGRVQLMALRVMGPRRVMARIGDQLSTADSVTKVTAREVSPTHFELSFNETGGVARYVRGLLEEAMSQIGAKSPVVTIVSEQPTGPATFSVKWS